MVFYASGRTRFSPRKKRATVPVPVWLPIPADAAPAGAKKLRPEAERSFYASGRTRFSPQKKRATVPVPV